MPYTCLDCSPFGAHPIYGNEADYQKHRKEAHGEVSAQHSAEGDLLLDKAESKDKPKKPKTNRKEISALLSGVQAAGSSLDQLIALRNQLEAINSSLTQEVIDLMATAQDILAQQQELDAAIAQVNAQVDQQIANSISAEDAQTISDNVAAEITAVNDISAKLPPVTGPAARRPPARR